MRKFTNVHDRLSWQLHQINAHGWRWGLLEYFEPDEFVYPAQMAPEFLCYLDCVRWEATRLARMLVDDAEIEMEITSDHRPGDTRSHGSNPCWAVDIRCRDNTTRYFITTAAYEVGFKRIGVRYHDNDRDRDVGHIHLDLADRVNSDRFPSFVMW
jgi:hypothetical protein